MRTSMCGPSLERRRISPHRRKVRVVQPVQNLLLLSDTRPSLTVIRSKGMRSHGQPVPLLGRLAVVGFHKPAPDEEDISNFDIAALSLRPDVDSLVLAALVQLFKTDRIIVIRIVLNALLMCIAAIVEQNTPTGDAVLGPVVDGAFVVGLWAVDVFAVCIIVERRAGNMGELQTKAQSTRRPNGGLVYGHVETWQDVNDDNSELHGQAHPSHCVPL